MTFQKLFVLGAMAALVAGCAQQEEPRSLPVIAPDPVFDKFGSGSCTEGYIYVPGAVPELAECVPEDECDPVFDANGNVIECPPPPRVPDRQPFNDDDDNGPSAPQRDPTTGVAGTPGRT